MSAGFDWDDGNLDKCIRHGVSRVEVEEVFRGPFREIDDPAHSAIETRSRAIGRVQSGRWVLVAFTYRNSGDRTLVRPISARYMHRKEIERYERQAPPPPADG